MARKSKKSKTETPCGVPERKESKPIILTDKQIEELYSNPKHGSVVVQGVIVKKVEE